jgi:hypothetical protein
MTNPTLIRPVIDSKRALTNAFKLGLWEINLKGLKILKSLTIFDKNYYFHKAEI